MGVSEVGKRNRDEEGINCGYSLMFSCFVCTGKGGMGRGIWVGKNLLF